MLYLVGIGLNKGDLPISAVELCKRSEVYIERSTTYVDDERLGYISRAVGKSIRELSRADMEENSGGVIGRAKEHDVVILVGGDPLIATTHKILFIEAKRKGVKVKVRHAPSILPAIMGESGLDFYRFGAICTIPKWVTHYTPVSFYETISRNMANGLHSIVLLDYNPTTNSSLELGEALRVLEEAEKKYKAKIISDGTLMLIMHKMSIEGEQKVFATLKYAKKLRYANGPTAIVIPAKLTDIEKETIVSMYDFDFETKS
jgi:diphthine synthase